MTKDEFITALRETHAQWLQSRQAVTTGAAADPATEHGQHTARLCALLTEAFETRDDVADDELAAAVGSSPTELRDLYRGICSPQPSTS